MKRSTPSKEAVVTTATPLASMPPEPVISEAAKAKAAEGAEKETSLSPVVVLEPEEVTEEQPEPQKAKAIEEEAMGVTSHTSTGKGHTIKSTGNTSGEVAH